MSISSEFNGNPQVWSLTRRFVTPAASYVGAPGALPSGDGSFVFDASMVYAGHNGSILRVAGWTDLFDSFNAFYLSALPNQDNSMALNSANTRCLTADMSGCQFLAYGPDRNNLTVEHNNYFGPGAARLCRQIQSHPRRRSCGVHGASALRRRHRAGR